MSILQEGMLYKITEMNLFKTKKILIMTKTRLTYQRERDKMNLFGRPFGPAFFLFSLLGQNLFKFVTELTFSGLTKTR